MTQQRKGGNGWRAGTDPIQRILRIIALLAALVAFAVLTLDPTRGDDLGVLGIVAGVMLVLLGYEGMVRIPNFLQRQQQPEADYEEEEYQPEAPPPRRRRAAPDGEGEVRDEGEEGR